MPSLLAILGLDAASFQQKLSEAQKLAGTTGQSMASSLSGPIKGALGAFAAGALIKGAFETADRIKTLSNEYRQSAETIQKWDIAARRAGMSAEDMGNALNRLKKARQEAVSGGKLGGFGEFQVPMEALKDASITTEQILERMIEVAGGANITDAQDVAGMELMGKSGARLLSAFQELHDLGPVSLLKDDEVERMHEAIEGFENLKRSAASLAGKGFIGATAAPKSLWETVKDLWRYASPFGGRPHGPVFGEGQAAGEGMTVVSETGPDKLHGPVVQGMTVEQQKEWQRLQLEVSEKIFQNNLKTLTTEERRAQLNKQIAEHMKASEKAWEDADWIKAEQERLKAENLRGELLLVKDSTAGKKVHADVNALQKIGAYSSQETALEQTVKQILTHVQHIAQKPSPSAAGHIGGF